MQRLKILASVGIAALAGTLSLSATAKAANTTVKVMTQNMNAGTDLKLALAYMQKTPKISARELPDAR